jgi:two-component system NtrC family sensor kinase
VGPRRYRSLRQYLLVSFIPLSVLPVLLLSFAAYVLMDRLVNQETERRSKPELSSLNLAVSNFERRIQKRLSDFSRRSQVLEALEYTDRTLLKQLGRDMASLGPFESLRFYNARGMRLDEAVQRDTDELWQGFFSQREAIPNLRRPQAVLDVATFFKHSARFENDQRSLSRDFRRFLRVEDSWMVRQVREQRFEWVFFKTVLDENYRVAGFIEGQVRLSDPKLRSMAQSMGVHLALWSPELQALSSTSSELDELFRSPLSPTRGLSGRSLRDLSFDLEVGRKQVRFFLTALVNEGGDPIGWWALGLDTSEMKNFQMKMIYWIAALSVLLGFVAIYLTVRVSDRITQPLSALVRAVDAVRVGEWVQPVDNPSGTEVGILVRRFNEMAHSVQVTKKTLESKLKELAETNHMLTDTQSQLVQSAKLSSLGQLVAGVAHELNNPIAFIYSNMSQMRSYLTHLESLDSLLKDLIGKLPDEQAKQLQKELETVEWNDIFQDMKDMVKSSLEGSIRVKDIVIGLRNFSRQDTGEMSDCDLNMALENTAKLLSGQFKNRVRLHWNLGSQAKAYCNPSQIQQVMMNLLANAAQAISGEGDIWVESGQRQERGQLWSYVSVRDNGSGIDPKNLDRIFDPFFTTKRVGEGTGLGLSIAYGIVHRHGGEIRVRSTPAPSPGHGSEFVVILPPSRDRQNSGAA